MEVKNNQRSSEGLAFDSWRFSSLSSESKGAHASLSKTKPAHGALDVGTVAEVVVIVDVQLWPGKPEWSHSSDGKGVIVQVATGCLFVR